MAGLKPGPTYIQVAQLKPGPTYDADYSRRPGWIGRIQSL